MRKAVELPIVALVALFALDIVNGFSASSTSKSKSTLMFSAPGLHHAAPRRLASTSTRLFATFDETCDVLVLGSGPAARAISSLLGASSSAGPLQVVMADQNLDRSFAPNYGAWQDEWDTVVKTYSNAGVELTGGKDGTAIDRTWSVTDCYFGGSFDIPVTDQVRLDRPYYRVDKDALRDSLTPGSGPGPEKYRLLKANHISTAIANNVYTPAGTLMHDADGTTIQLQTKDGTMLTVRTKLVVDCTGHETKLVLRESREPSQLPGFQIAYGCLVEVDESSSNDLAKIGPYDKEAMTLFDYRTDHYDTEPESAQQKLQKSPTFMYAMPLENNQIFFEETSLVARPAISFQECKDRCMQRLKHHGITVTKLIEEEFCYIPMGGALPAKDQRVLALGGAAAMVHPSTGYHLCRCMMGASDMSKAILQELAVDKPNLDRAAASAYHALWSPSNIMQRNFAVFGGEYLMKQDVVGLRGFFDGFFRLPMPMWAGFLAGWPGLPNNEKHDTWYARMWYGLNFLYQLPPPVALDMYTSIISYIATTNLNLAQSVTPLLGEPASYEYKHNKDNVGDVAAKNEARRMIQESKITVDLPVDFSGKNAPENEESTISSSTPMPSVTESVKVPSDFQ